MGIIAYKAFKKGLIATHGNGNYKFKEGENITDAAQCASCGFHCAEDPLDMFSYYPPNKDNEYRVVVACGDIHEDGHDSRIACTRMFVKRKLSISEVAAAALLYMKTHPERSRDFNLSGYFKIRVGENPFASGKKGEWLCFLIIEGEKVREYSMLYIDGKKYKPNVMYYANGEKKDVQTE